MHSPRSFWRKFIFLTVANRPRPYRPPSGKYVLPSYLCVLVKKLNSSSCIENGSAGLATHTTKNTQSWKFWIFSAVQTWYTIAPGWLSFSWITGLLFNSWSNADFNCDCGQSSVTESDEFYVDLLCLRFQRAKRLKHPSNWWCHWNICSVW